ncbi:Uncharacterized protein conserved in bacteria [Slackia heliotrinireducens]|uniref:ABC-2 family transporter protein n=1 Tax=Slackia heliotrinireducens (strain ATCC 29202 / DSM 20476 / NCTC 11029 / RHS 1) TaxID=471855 RepID=C7N3P6_SLAHD|nr:ABC transporter permease [Slackia heliotrinireducens]ACV21637.1 hypothetical protein Shel_05780 [Slackia heliotrinireducens DSM 20476]VEG99216.1 Uncharacterized protein conserved in bacteria [Slackia heliotrinireducens]
MSYLGLEFSKIKRKRVLLMAVLLVAAALAWVLMGAWQDGEGSELGWSGMFFSMPVINCVLMSLLATVVASRVVDVDHEAGAFKQLLCLQSTGGLLAAKLACAVLIMVFAVTLELAGVFVIGQAMRFPSVPGFFAWASLFASQLAASVCMLILVGVVALKWENQFVAVAVGLALSLAGLFSNFLPTALQRLVPSGYFTLLSTLRIDWNAESTAPVFYQSAVPWPDYVIVVLVCVAVCALGVAVFSRKEH